MTPGELKTLMESRGWEAKDVAELLQVTRSCVYNWVNEWRSGKGADGTTKDRFPDAVEISMTLKKEVKGKNKEYSMQIVVPLHFPNNLEKSTSSDATSTNRGGNNGGFQ